MKRWRDTDLPICVSTIKLSSRPLIHLSPHAIDAWNYQRQRGDAQNPRSTEQAHMLEDVEDTTSCLYYDEYISRADAQTAI